MRNVVARQPIFNKDKNVVAYKLSFKDGLESEIEECAKDQKSAAVITDSFFAAGIEKIIGMKPAFVDFTYHLLRNEYFLYIPKKRLVIEIDNQVPRNEDVLKTLQKLNLDGYKLAFSSGQKLRAGDPFLKHIHIIKLDFDRTTSETQYIQAANYLPCGFKMLADKVRTHEDFRSAEMLGYSYFQGSFFQEPENLQKGRIHDSKMAKLNLVALVNQPEIDFKKVSDLIQYDVDLSYRLLRFINSAYFGLRGKIKNIQQAVIHMGARDLKKWASLMAAACLCANKPSELMKTSIVRASTFERLADYFGLSYRKDELFILGLFSVLDAMLDAPMEDIIQKVPLQQDIKDALMGKSGNLRRILDFIIGIEEGDWSINRVIEEEYKKIEAALPSIQVEAFKLAEDVLNMSPLEAGSNR